MSIVLTVVWHAGVAPLSCFYSRLKYCVGQADGVLMCSIQCPFRSVTSPLQLMFTFTQYIGSLLWWRNENVGVVMVMKVANEKQWIFSVLFSMILLYCQLWYVMTLVTSLYYYFGQPVTLFNQSLLALYCRENTFDNHPILLFQIVNVNDMLLYQK